LPVATRPELFAFLTAFCVPSAQAALMIRLPQRDTQVCIGAVSVPASMLKLE
jgi:hypothetical protein